jgi:hypothetical protein
MTEQHDRTLALSPPATPTAAQMRIVVTAVERARVTDASIPKVRRICWHRADNATPASALEQRGSELVLHLNARLVGRSLLFTETLHQLVHARDLRAGRRRHCLEVDHEVNWLLNQPVRFR